MSLRLTAKPLQAELGFSCGLLNILLVSEVILFKGGFDAKSFEVLTVYKTQSSRTFCCCCWLGFNAVNIYTASRSRLQIELDEIQN